MEKKPKLLQKNFIIINKNQVNTRPKTTKEKIQDLITQNEAAIKKYEKLKEQTQNLLKKEEYDQTISKYRGQQVHLHNKLYSINLFLNMCMNNGKNNNNIPKPKPKFENSNNLYLKQYFHKKVNSALKPNFNYSNIYTNSNNESMKRSFINKDNYKYSSSISTLFDNKKLSITNPVKKISLINNKKKELKYNYNNLNSKYSKIILNTSTRVKPKTNEIGNTTLINSSSTKFDNNRIKNKYIIKTIKENNKFSQSKKNIFIINNINNYYNNNYFGKIKNNSTKNSNLLMSNLYGHIVNKNIRKKIKDKILKYNIIDEDEQLDINLNYDNDDKKICHKKEIMNENLEFSSYPNLFLKKKFFKIKNHSVVEVYYAYHDNNELYLAISEKNIIGYNIKIIKFKNRIFITRLKRHNNRVVAIKHFFNKNKMHDFLISGDMDRMVNVWDVSYKYSVNQFIYSIDYHGENLYKLFLVSYEEKENINNYILIYDKSVNIYKLTDGKFIKNVNHFPLKEEKIINIISWKNKDNNLDYIIKCTKYKIVIFNFLDEDIFFELSNYLRSNNNNQKSLCYKSEGCIISYNLGDYLCILSSSMNLEIWDLYNLCLKKQIPIKANLIDDTYLFGIIPWSNRYILLYDGDNNYIYVLDVKFCNVLSKISGSFKNNIRQIFCQKIISKKYGESLLVWCYNRHISLFSSNDFYIKIFDE